jgi:hypothetical protein
MRTPLDGLAVVEYAARPHRFRIADVSFGGVRLVGDAGEVLPGRLVRVMLTLASGKKLDAFPRLESWAVVQRAGDGEVALAWSLANPVRAEQIIYLVADAADAAHAASVSAPRAAHA